MRIIYLAHRIPYPPNKGDKIRSYHHVRHLAERHDVSVFAFVDEAADEDGAARLREYCREVVTIRLHKPVALARGALWLAAGRSLSEGFYRSRALRHAIARAAAREPFDVAWAFSSVMAQYFAATNAPRRIVDCVDVDSEKWRQFGEDSRGPLRYAYRLEASRLRAFEAQLNREADQVLFVSPAEADLFRSFCPDAGRVGVIPNGVDTEYFRPAGVAATLTAVQSPRSKVQSGREESSRAETTAHVSTPDATPPTVLFTGALDYRPNIDAVLFFVREVLPLVRREIPDAGFLAVGHRPAPELLREAHKPDGALRIAGSVPDIRPYFAETGVYVAPLRLGRGVQNKVLEAMAMRLPVVASPLAVAGLAAEGGTHVLVADTPEQFAAAVVSLLRNPQRAAQLSAAAGRLISERYTWQANLQLLDDTLAQSSILPSLNRVSESLKHRAIESLSH